MNETVASRNTRLAVKLLLFVIGMIGFSIALIPMYDVLSEKTGINGKVEAAANEALLQFSVDKQREFSVDFITSLGKSMPLEFRTETKKLQVNPGQFYEINYFARNSSDTVLVARAVPSISPGVAAADFKIVSCFCFEPMRFEAGESKQLRLRFVIDPKLTLTDKNIALAITFLNTNKN